MLEIAQFKRIYLINMSDEGSKMIRKTMEVAH